MSANATANGGGSLSPISAYSYLGNSTGLSASPVANQNLILGTPSYTASGSQITGTAANYFGLTVQNLSNNASASSDFVATADNGNDTTHYADFGINSSGGGAAPFTGINAAYLYSTDAELDIGALGTNGTVKFYCGGGTATPAAAGSISASGLTVGAGSAVNGVLSLNNATNNNTVGIKSSITTASYTFSLPVAVATASSMLLSDASGNLTYLAVGTPTGSTNLVYSASPTFTGTVIASAITASGIATFSLTGASTQSSVLVTGTPFSGTATNAQALVYLNNGTAPTTWNIAGTYFAINGANASSADLINCFQNGSSVFKVSNTGFITGLSSLSCVTVLCGNLNNGNNSITVFQTANSATATTFMVAATTPIFKFAGTTSSFPAIKRTAAALNFRLADDSADCAVTCAGITASGIVQFSGTNSTGAGSALLSTNCPAVTATAPYTWITVKTSDGSTAFIPAWK